MGDVKSIIEFCGLTGTVILSFCLVVSGIIRWLHSAESHIEQRRRNIISWIAFGVLCIMLAVHFKVTELPVNESNSLEAVVSAIMGLLMFGTVVFTVLLLLLVCIFFLYHVMCIVFQGKNGKGNAGNKYGEASQISDCFVSMIKLPIIRGFIAWGIVALFFILPVVVGGNFAVSPIENYNNGIANIVRLFHMNNYDNEDTVKIFLSYMLLYIIVLGVGFAVIKILSTMIGHAFEKKKEKEMIDEYAGSIALLVIGIALLWTFQGDEHSEIIIKVLKSFGAVLIIITLIIFCLEIIRLLMDMKEKLIRKEARYVFIALIGQSAMLLVGILNTLYGAVNSVIGSIENTEMNKVESNLKKRMVKVIDAQINSENIEDREEDNSHIPDMTFPVFEERITKK